MRIRQHVVPAKAGTHTPQQYRETAEYGSRASLTLARDDSGTIVLSSAKWPHINTSSPRRRGPMLRRQYRETAEYGSRASLTLARDDSTSTPRRRPRLREDRLQRGPIRRSNIEKLRSVDPGPRSRSPGTTAHQHVVPVPACARTGSSGDPYAAAISRNCGVWIPGLAHARPGRQHINTSSPRRRGPIGRSNIEKLRSMDPGASLAL